MVATIISCHYEFGHIYYILVYNVTEPKLSTFAEVVLFSTPS